jgi:plasmid stabilization system protein ParE
MVRIRKEAEKDLKEAFEWYERQRIGLGQSFLEEISRSISLIQAFPSVGPHMHKTCRRTLCRRFPYAIYYLDEHSDIVVIAVLHQRHHPANWHTRASR